MNTPTRHNHITRDIKPEGQCPVCDEYHARRKQEKEFWELLKDVEISFSTTCRECGIEYAKVPMGYTHDCKTGEFHKIIFPEHMVKAAEAEVEEMMKDLKLKKDEPT